MISSWRTSPPSPPRQAPPQKEPHIWDQVTVEQNAKMTKSTEDTNTLVTSMIDHMPPEQQSAFKNYQASRANKDASGERKP